MGLSANEKIAIIGTGLVGRAWSTVFARAGFRVVLYDPISPIFMKCQQNLVN